MTSPCWDVAILGGGPAGCGTALALRRLGVERVLVLEAGAYGVARIGESAPPDICRILDGALGVWPAFLAENHEPCYGSCSAWGSDEPGYNDFLFNPYGHGWHLDRTRFDAFLAASASARGATVRIGTRFEAADALLGGGWRLRLAGGADGAVEARFVVDATGPRGRFVRAAGARTRTLDRLVFVAGFFALPEDGPLSRMTLLEAAPDGWWYAARLPQGRCVAAFASDPDLIRRARLSEAGPWLEALGRTGIVAPALGGASLEESGVRSWAAPGFLRDPVAGPDWLAAGDAASTYDPLSSQGIHKALADAMDAADAIAGALAGRTDATAAYAAAVARRFEDYRANRNHFYALESRWADRPFWRRRRERTALGGSGDRPESPAPALTA